MESWPRYHRDESTRSKYTWIVERENKVACSIVFTRGRSYGLLSFALLSLRFRYCLHDVSSYLILMLYHSVLENLLECRI